MKTERLYFADPHLVAFRARVVRTDGLKAALDRTAFYPAGGGQPADQGQLSGVRVVDVQSDADLVWHTLERPLERTEVEGLVDWPRRLDHMQQHHGQHLLSAAFERLFGFPTTSFHLGDAYSAIDLAAEAVSESQLASAEDLANQVIWEDRPVQARFVTPEELARLPLRKPPVVEGSIRVVSVPDFDHSACGGTHPRSTGVVGLIHLRRTERRGNATRVEFLCGGRAVRDLRAKNALLASVTTALTVGPDELAAAVARIRDAEQAARRRLQDAMERLAGYEAVELVAKDPVVRRAYSDRSLDDLKLLAQQVAERGGTALLGLASGKGQLVFASPAGSAVNCGALLKEVVAQFGGKGGGQPHLAQGGIPDPAKLEAALDLASRRLRLAGSGP